MIAFPEVWQLESVFEGKVTLLDPGVHPAYNQLTFAVDRPLGRVVCSIEPSSGALWFRCSAGSRTIIDLAVSDVARIATWATGDGEGLIVTTEDEARGELRIQITPDVSIVWCAPGR
jgi:hypothetical protein